MIDFKLLVKAGVHFGHQSSRWHPRMAPYIWGQKNGVHLIDVSKTAHQLEKAAQFLESVATEGKTVMWIGTKKPAQVAAYEAGIASRMPFVTHRWIGGTLTNYIQVRKSVTKLLHLEEVLKKTTENSMYTKKELNSFQKRIDRLRKNVGGISAMRWPVAAIVVIDVRKEMSAVKEAITMGVPVIALVDTNSDPSGVQFVIPANDDAPRSIKVLIDYLAASVQRGRDTFERVRKEALEKEKALLGEGGKKKDAAPAVVKQEQAAQKATVQEELPVAAAAPVADKE